MDDSPLEGWSSHIVAGKVTCGGLSCRRFPVIDMARSCQLIQCEPSVALWLARVRDDAARGMRLELQVQVQAKATFEQISSGGSRADCADRRTNLVARGDTTITCLDERNGARCWRLSAWFFRIADGVQ